MPILLLIWACEKNELPVTPQPRGDVKNAQVEMGPTYKYQAWFSLRENMVVLMNARTDWDIALECSGNHILLNGAKGMRAYKTQAFEFAAVKDTSGLATNGKADVPSGDLDSTAIGQWQPGNVYILNLGFSETGKHQGFYKFRIIQANDESYTIEYAGFKSPEVNTAIVLKNTNYNFTAFSFSAKTAIQIEPQKNTYDLCFTQYTHIFTNPFSYYQVTGALLNRHNTAAACLREKQFDAVTIRDTLGVTFSTKLDVIGYDWKEFNLVTNEYKVDTARVYLIKDSEGYFYKLRFLDFYNAQKEKGYPRFEYKKL